MVRNFSIFVFIVFIIISVFVDEGTASSTKKEASNQQRVESSGETPKIHKSERDLNESESGSESDQESGYETVFYGAQSDVLGPSGVKKRRRNAVSYTRTPEEEAARVIYLAKKENNAVSYAPKAAVRVAEAVRQAYQKILEATDPSKPTSEYLGPRTFEVND